MSNTSLPANSVTEPLLAGGFADSFRKYPQNNALFITGRYYSYSELMLMAEQVSASIHNITSHIGIFCTESAWTYAALIAVSLNGAAYVPLNSKLPAERLSRIIKSCGLTAVITERHEEQIEKHLQVLINKTAIQPLPIVPKIAQDLAYILFTSGSTGKPKGVPVSRKNVNSFFRHMEKNFLFVSADRFLQPYELSFDVSVFSAFTAWNAGACVYVVPEKGFKYLNILTTIKEHGITVSSMVPTALFYLEKYLRVLELPSLRYCFFSGDKLYHRHARLWQKAAVNAEIHNCYGPTETTIVCTSFLWKDDSTDGSLNGIVPLGKPFEGMQYVILGDDGPVKPGMTGELCFSGDQVIRAYLEGAGENSFFELEGRRFYRTGDLVSEGPSGLLFHGRSDSQVKINGYRVELAEVEHELMRICQVHLEVLALEKNGLNRLVAFSEEVCNQDKISNAGSLLPAYMMPSEFIVVTFPLGLNGKIDRQKLKEIYGNHIHV